MKQVPVYSVVGWSGSGKTTLLEKLLRELKQRGFRVAVVKHDAHDFEIDREGKDSWRMTKAGADVTVLASQTKAVIQENRYVPVEKLIGTLDGVDMILTEGYKHGPWPKILIHRKVLGKAPPVAPGNCLAVMTDEPLETTTTAFHLDDIKALANFLLYHAEGGTRPLSVQVHSF